MSGSDEKKVHAGVSVLRNIVLIGRPTPPLEVRQFLSDKSIFQGVGCDDCSVRPTEQNIYKFEDGHIELSCTAIAQPPEKRNCKTIFCKFQID
jgi:hypothetical protein